MKKILLLVAGLLLVVSGAGAAEPEWVLQKEDDFSRVGLGTDWLVLRGEWHINAEKQLQIQRQWCSHSYLMHTLSLRGQNVKVELDVQVPSRLLGFRQKTGGAVLDGTAIGIRLQAGPLGWGGGGIDDAVGIDLTAKAGAEGNGKENIAIDRWVHVVLTLIDGQFTATVDGKRVTDKTVPQGRSLVNATLQFYAVPCGVFDNLKIYARPMAKPLPAVSAATPKENRKATILLSDKTMDMTKPDCGIQEAIDSLPPGGGVVVLPKGTFPLRTFLDLHSHTVLAGQGPETILQAIPMTGVAVESVASEGDVHRLTVKAPHDFRPGDAFAYGFQNGGSPNWGHPMKSKNKSGNRLTVLAVDGNVLTVSAPPASDVRKPYRIAHFFPPVCSYESEFAEVKDLTIRGSKENPVGCKGGFMINPITFGVTSHPRFTRLLIEQFPADGISAQLCDEARFLDCTFRGTFQGMHPGTGTFRTLVARNYSVDNGTGLYFCWYNQQGIYLRNMVKKFTGYPDSGDSFNTLSFNRLTHPMTITVGYNGCLYANSMPGLQVSLPKAGNRPGGRTYGLAARYFSIGANTIDKLTLMKGAWGNVLAANVLADGTPTPVAHVAYLEGKETPTTDVPENVILANDATVAPIKGLPNAITRTEPVAPPALPVPVLDGTAFYRPGTPDCGFQAALNKLAAKGGTLRLPGGRYVLAEPLKVPAGVTLVGYGSSTVLLPEGKGHSLVSVSNAAKVTLREFAIEGTWQKEGAGEAAAVIIEKADNLTIAALDIRGWAGDAVRISGGRKVSITDCRVFRCAGTGYVFNGVEELLCETNSAVLSGAGFVVREVKQARLFGNIAGLNQGVGYHVISPGALLAGNNAHNNLKAGVLVDGVADVVVAGNTFSANNQGCTATAGIHLAGATTGARVLFNNCGDEQQVATQRTGILEEPTAAGSEIRFNCTATLTARSPGEASSLLAKGSKSTVADNWTDTLLPANDSLEVIEWLRAQPWQKK